MHSEVEMNNDMHSFNFFLLFYIAPTFCTLSFFLWHASSFLFWVFGVHAYIIYQLRKQRTSLFFFPASVTLFLRRKINCFVSWKKVELQVVVLKGLSQRHHKNKAKPFSFLFLWSEKIWKLNKIFKQSASFWFVKIQTIFRRNNLQKESQLKRFFRTIQHVYQSTSALWKCLGEKKKKGNHQTGLLELPLFGLFM